MFAGANWNGKSPLIFNVEKVRMKRARKRDGVRGFRYEKYTITQATRAADIEDELKPWMDETGSDFLILDNTSVQVFQGPLFDRLKISGPGFGSVRVNDDGGAPARSPDTSILDAALFKNFERDFHLSNLRNTGEAIARATKIWEAIPQSEVRKHICGFRGRLQAILDKNGGPTKWMDSKYVCES